MWPLVAEIIGTVQQARNRNKERQALSAKQKALETSSGMRGRIDGTFFGGVMQ
jgi:hypothetical protein